MRINLVTPFAAKDEVKALGARWDAVRKTWYVVDVADLTPFMRWIPNLEAAMETGTDGSSAAPSPLKPAARKTSSAPVTTHSKNAAPGCGCAVLPWEDCMHTTPGV